MNKIIKASISNDKLNLNERQNLTSTVWALQDPLYMG
jgi:hypothetical protein